MMRQCNKCNKLYEATSKGQKKCEKCKVGQGSHMKNYVAPKSTLDLKKLMILKKNIAKMSYKEAIE